MLKEAGLLPPLEVIFRLVLAGIFGGLIGLERESLRKSAGFRTHILVCVGSTLFMLVSMEMYLGYHQEATVDPGRIAAQVVTGIGFLGAGSIMREGVNVRGLTTAASLWVVAGLGLAIGSGLYFAASIATGIVFVALVYLGKMEKRLSSRKLYRVLTLTVEDQPGQMGLIGEVLNQYQANTYQIKVQNLNRNGRIQLELNIKLPKDVSMEQIMHHLMTTKGVYEVELEE